MNVNLFAGGLLDKVKQKLNVEDLDVRLLNGGTRRRSLSTEERQEIQRQLRATRATNRGLVIVAAAAHVAVLVVSLYLAVVNKDNQTYVLAILGGSSVGLLAVGRALMYLAERNAAIDVLLTMMPSLSNEEILNALLALKHGEPEKA